MTLPLTARAVLMATRTVGCGGLFWGLLSTDREKTMSSGPLTLTLIWCENQRASVTAFTEALISCSPRADIAKSQIQSLIVLVAELQ